MAGILDRIKGMFGAGKGDAEAGDADTGNTVDHLKEQAGELKDKVDDLVEKVGDKVPDKVKETYEKVSDKVEDIIPGKKHDDEAGEAEAASDD